MAISVCEIMLVNKVRNGDSDALFCFMDAAYVIKHNALSKA